ncbi:MAG: hypothetical protein A2V98_00105 [Planctomycetes bacterium RBG_16_64_12]|nr:MAG: hypothetical protein A2V98_00105 [Planctomycetes bacterium RBG_16_64_12]
MVDPPFEEVAGLVRANLSCRREYRYDLQGRCLSEVARESRRQLVAEARRWTSQYRDVDPRPFDPSAPIFLAGHQPELFHPGVWFKNFALGTLARQHGAVAVNLLIDSDVFRTPSVRVPGGPVTQPQVAEIPMDKAGPLVPYEERPILDRDVFAEFGRRAAEQIARLVPDPLVRQFWPMALQRMQATSNLGACLAQSRHQLEGQWGLETLEIPQSRVCQAEPHAWFVAHLLAQLPRLWTIYNEVVDEYRRVNRVRSRAHPVPNLAAEGEWLEAPFWIWTGDDPCRRRLFAKRGRDRVVLSDRHAHEIALPLQPDGDAGRAAQRLVELGREGVKIRSRALVTTLWARLVLGDLFLHGIGGAKYDQVTDAIVRRFFGLKPPGFLVLSATLHLPVARQRAAPEDLRAIQRGLRRLTYHPECYINGAGEVAGACGKEVAELIAAKKRWIQTCSTRQNARTRYEEIRRINEALAPCVAPLRERLHRERRETEQSLKAEAVLRAREYPFCLFPEKTLREFLVSLLHKCEKIGSDNP